ncbi:MAG TPA: tRNA (adenosine(37)-N6)-dimethylallyltransferase MiaA [Candidatus Acidoferrales bacterium]|nr:tRNA (adenosine(37)-N6)-dimethylallyltransferase MiaA [Candidatus Acidoferrales bacterium]
MPEESPIAAAAPLVALVGPTASGKSTLAVWLAEHISGEIVVCDSTQVYRGFDVGTAKATPVERQRVPHHLIDILDPEQVFTAGEYRQRAIAVLDDLRSRGRVPILTAGTGLYLRALLEGLSDAPLRSEELRARLQRRAARNKPGYLHRLLSKRDPEAAGRIAPADTPKLIRAIEVSVLAGKPITELHRAGRKKLEGFRPIKIGLNPPRTALYERIERRTHEMIESGWLQEVRSLVARGIPATAKAFSFIGYRELREHLEGKRELPVTIAAIQRATRRYAKRQLTWFRKEQGVHWLEGFGDDPAIAQAALREVQPAISSATAGS